METTTHTDDTGKDQIADSLEALRRVLQSDVVLSRLCSVWPTDGPLPGRPVACELARVHLRGSDELVLDLELRTRDADGETTISLVGELVGEKAPTHYAEAVASLRKPRRKQLDVEEVEKRIFCFADLGLVLRFPALDERIPGLALVHKTRTAKPAFARFTSPAGTPLTKISAEILAHRLGKRCAVRFKLSWKDPATGESETRTVIAKMYKARSDAAAQAYERSRALVAAGFGPGSNVRVPAPLGLLEKWNTVVMERVRGRSADTLDPADLPAGIAAAGRVIAALHAAAPVVTERHTVDDECAILERWIGFVARVHPQLAAPTAEALHGVSQKLRSLTDAPTTMIHRDYYPAQVIVADNHATLLDFDTLCVGDPALDLGNFIAHLDLFESQGLGETAGLDEAFIEAYGNTTDELRERIRVYRRATLLRLACLYSFWPRWRGVPERLLERLS